MTREMLRLRCPENVLGWIPWYGETGEDGRPLLDDRQRGAVEAHAAQCPDCRAEIDMIRGAPFEIDFELPDPHRVFDEITERIEAGEAERGDDQQTPVIPIDRGRALEEGDVQKIADWLFDPATERALTASDDSTHEAETPGATVIEGPWARSSLVAAAAAMLVFFLGGLGGIWLSEREQALAVDGLAAEGVADTPVYQLAAAPKAGLAAIEVVFRDSASASQISQTLRAAGVEIVSGPSSAGVYGLRPVDPAIVEPSEVAAIVARLREGDAPVVLYAEPTRPAPR